MRENLDTEVKNKVGKPHEYNLPHHGHIPMKMTLVGGRDMEKITR
jgi:hypothetical protein